MSEVTDTATGFPALRTWWRDVAASRVLPGTLDGPGDGRVTGVVDAVEALGREGAPPGWVYALTSQIVGVQMPLAGLLGSRAATLLDGVERGERLLCHALTEEGGGSDPLGMRTTARRVPGGWELTGRKAFVTAAPVADLALVFARTEEGDHPFVLSPFLVDLAEPGVVRHPPFPKTVLTDVPMGGIDFDAVAVPDEHLLGEEGSGLGLLGATTTWERGLLAAHAVGEMDRVLERTLARARERRHFGRAMGASHLVAGRVADMAAARLRTRTLARSMAARFDAGESAHALATDAALVKLSAAEDLVTFARHASALGGVRSFVENTGLTTDVGSAVAAGTYAGPDDLLRVGAARALGLPVQN